MVLKLLQISSKNKSDMKKLYIAGLLIVMGLSMAIAQETQLKPGNETTVQEVYPNPFTGTININIGAKGNELVQVDMFDIIGNQVFTGTYMVNREDKIISFNPENEKIVKNSAYLVRVKAGDKVFTQRILKR